MTETNTWRRGKIGIVSCYFQHNYGSMLQAYATQQVLERLGYDNETIDISGFRGEIGRAKLLYFIKASLTSDILIYKIGMAKSLVMRKLLRNEYSTISKIRNRKFEHFARTRFHMSETYASRAELGAKCPEKYSAVLVGSDQLWLPANIAADYYTLGFVPDKLNTIAYATSFGQASLPVGSEKKAAVFLKKIRHIGVREASGRKLVEKLSGRKVPVVCDPVLLFTGEEWMRIQQQEPVEKEPYILCYFLGQNPQHREFAKRLRSKTGLPIVALPHMDEYVKADQNYADKKRYDIGPAEFINLVRNAAYVCTDSYHCTIFSALYRREFFAFRRYPGATMQSTNSRLDSILRELGIKDRLLRGDEAIEACLGRKVDYDQVRRRIDLLRRSSYKYLQDALEDKTTDL